MSANPPVEVEDTEDKSSITEPNPKPAETTSAEDADNESTSGDGSSLEEDEDGEPLMSPKKEGSNDADDDESDKQAKKRKPRGPRFTIFPKSSIKRAIDASYSHIPISDECVVLFNKVCELFIEHYTKIAVSLTPEGEEVDYEKLYDAIRSRKGANQDIRQSRKTHGNLEGRFPEVVPRLRSYGSIKCYLVNNEEEE